jgi:starch synthase
MRVLFVNENIGGHATVHVAIADALRAHPDVEAEFVHLPGPGLLRRVLAAPIPGLARVDLDLQPLRHQLAAAAVARRLLRARLDRFDALHVYTQNAALLSADLIRTRPTVVSTDSTNVRNAYHLEYRYPSRFTPYTLPATTVFERRVYRAATTIVANSRWIHSSLTGDYGIPEDKIRVLPFGLPVADLPDRPGHDVPRITFVGRSMERKGGRRLLRLHQQHLRDRCVLTLVTQDDVPGHLANVEVRTDVTPGDGKLASILAHTDVFVFPSSIDKSPNAILEAMAAALPVVALPVAAVPEMVSHGVTGLLVAEGDDEGLVAAIRSLLDDRPTARAMGARGRQQVVKSFNAETSTAGLVEIIREAVLLHHAQGPGQRQ